EDLLLRGVEVAARVGRRIDAVVDDLADAAARQRQRIVAEVRVAQPLTEEQERRLAEALTRLKGRRVRLNVAVDPDVLGGVHVTVGDEVIDGTVASRLEQARRAVLG
ncbi:MAG: ATP synthase F1 subunit delta, partial [bacterium]